jgi:hypothetical protein
MQCFLAEVGDMSEPDASNGAFASRYGFGGYRYQRHFLGLATTYP